MRSELSEWPADVAFGINPLTVTVPYGFNLPRVNDDLDSYVVSPSCICTGINSSDLLDRRQAPKFDGEYRSTRLSARRNSNTDLYDFEETNSMKTLRITSAALAIALGMGISSTSQAFMASPVEAQSTVENQFNATIEDFRSEIALGETTTDVMAAKIDAFVKHIDQMLDEGVENENLYLEAREEAIALRQTLPGLDKYLAGLEGGPIGGGSITSDVLIGERNLGPVGGGGGVNGGGVIRSAGRSVGGGGVGGGAIGGSGLGLLGAIGAAVAIPAATSSDDAPGPVASQSMMTN